MNKIPELLAPAGNWDALMAAVENGADAVYLGGTLFNARQNAGNFSDEELKKGIEYAHVRGVNIYLTLNTLLFNEELGQAVRFAEKAYTYGVDGVIVQDIGLARLLKEELPDLKLHASTQTTTATVNGVLQLKDMGFDRVVLARECSLNEMAEIVKASGIEIEVFVHGAQCISYSGQCLFSSMIGGRSGNRGKCAQPCRLPYELVKEKHKDVPSYKGTPAYIMSPKDLCGLPLLDELVRTGVHSLKIEGRMKSPEYVAVVVSIYRKYLDMIAAGNGLFQVEDNDMERLLQSFNRGGFTTGYMERKQGRHLICSEKPKNWGMELGKVTGVDRKRGHVQIRLIRDLKIGDGIEIWSNAYFGENEDPSTIVSFMSLGGASVKSARAGETVKVEFHNRQLISNVKTGDTVYRTSCKEWIEEAKQSYTGGARRKVPIWGEAVLSPGKPLVFTVWDDMGNRAEGESEIPAEPARTRPISEERLKEQLEKTGNTPFELEELTIHLDDGLALPVQEINRARRQALEALERLRSNRYPRRIGETGRRDIYDNGTGESRISENKAGADVNGADIENNICAKAKNGNNVPRLSVYFYDFPSNSLINQLAKSKYFENIRIYLPYQPLLEKSDGREIINMLKAGNNQVLIAFPPVNRGLEEEWILKNMSKFDNFHADGFMVGNLGLLRAVKKYMEGTNPESTNVECTNGVKGQKHGRPFILAGDFSLNTVNARTIEAYCSMGLDCLTLSPELMMCQVLELAKGMAHPETEIIIHGRIPVMTSEYCPVGAFEGKRQNSAERGCTCTSHPCTRDHYFLKDRKGACFPIRTNRLDGRSTVFYPDPLFLGKEIQTLLGGQSEVNSGMGPDFLRVNYLDEDEYLLIETVENYKRLLEGEMTVKDYAFERWERKVQAGGFTRGNFFRKV